MARRGQSLSPTARLLWVVVAAAVVVWVVLLLVGVFTT
jgi:predicted nucleic acid-binding Zn ribbon protein